MSTLKSTGRWPRKLLLSFLAAPFLALPAAAITATSTPNAYMVENTNGVDPNGNVCYKFQTNPSCSATIVNLSSGSLPSGSTQYIQNKANPTTNTQVFNVSSGTIATMNCTTCTLPTAFDSAGSSGTVGQVFTSQAGGTQWKTLSASAGGSPTQLQYNLGGVLAGIPSNVTASSVTISTPTAIGGSITNDSAAQGFVGETISSSTAGLGQNLTNGQWIDFVSMSLTAGDWDVTLVSIGDRNTATQVQFTDFEIGISSTAGNSTAGLLIGDNRLISNEGTTGITDATLTISSYRVSLVTTKTYYGKSASQFSGGQPVIYTRLSARRVR